MAKFKSKYRALTLQDAVKDPEKDGTGVWAQFEPSADKSCGEFETDDAKIIARLRKVEDVEEVKDEPKAESATQS